MGNEANKRGKEGEEAVCVSEVVMHFCEPEWAQNPDNRGGFGKAIEHCNEDENGEFWAGNGEYYTRVNYCPFCGAKAPMQVEG